MSHVAIIGAGHNGLIAALSLATGGHSVTVFERSAAIGGVCAPIEFHPGYTVPGLLHDTAVDPALVGMRLDLDLEPEPKTWVRDGEGFRALSRDLEGVDGADSWRTFLGRIRGLARAVMSEPPPPILPATTSDFWHLGKRGLGLRRLGRNDMIESMRVPPMCAADWVNEHFEQDQVLAEWVASAGVIHGFAGPWSAGTAANLMLAEVLRGPRVKGGPAALIRALETACKAAGVTIHTEAPVRRINVESGRATGLEVEGHGTVAADIILATCDPRTAMLDLVEPVHLPAKIEKQFLAIRARGTTAKLMLALDGPLELQGAPEAERAYIGGGSLDGLERAFDAVKYGEFSKAPVLDVWVPSVADSSLAPDGHHVVSVLASFAPYHLRAGWSDETREQLQDAILTRLSGCAPTLRDRIVGSALWTPVDIEAQVGIAGGCLQHVEHALDQLLFMRPTASSAQYATSIESLYLGGAGSHPSGGVTGIPGALAAQAIKRAK